MARLFLLMLSLNLFSPEVISVGRVRPDDIVFLVFCFFLFAQLGNALAGGKRCTLGAVVVTAKGVGIIYFFLVVSLMQILFIGMPWLYLFDLLKVFKLLLPLLYMLTLSSEQLEWHIERILHLLRIFVVVTFVFCIVQLMYPGFEFFALFASPYEQFLALGDGAYGIVGNRTHAGFASLLCFCVFLRKGAGRIACLSFANLLMHGNKMSLLCALLAGLLVFLSSRRFSVFSKSLMLAPLLSAAVYVFVFFVFPVVDAALTLGVDRVHTFSHRLDMLNNAVVLYRADPLMLFMLGSPQKELWDVAFDSQLILMVMRYGVLLGGVYFCLPLFFLLGKQRLIALIALSVPSISMVTLYHYKLALLSAVVLAIFFFYSKQERFVAC